MQFIGITGGVGCGKSAVMRELAKRYNCVCFSADDIARDLRSPGCECFEQIVEAFDKMDVFVRNDSGEIVDIDSDKMAKLVFRQHDKLFLLNSIIHPAVKRYILSQVESARRLGKVDYLFFEAALIFEEGYDKLCDGVMYIRSPEYIRRQRLKESREYSDEKIDAIMAAQLSDDEFACRATYVIDNDLNIEVTMNRIEAALTK